MSGVRASDVERHDVAEALQQHYAAGRLTLAELDERVTAAYAAVTRGQLATLLADLPSDPTAASPVVPPVVPLADVTPVVRAGDPAVQCALWFLFPPAGLAYWLCTRRNRRAGRAGRRAPLAAPR